MKIFWLFLFLLPFQVFAQMNVTGIVTDAANNQPVIYATIYINGTTKGTITNTSGQYLLEGVVPPCEIVFSHISYETIVISFDESSETNINILLKPKDVVIGDVQVVDNNLRAGNLKHFKEQFLGTDYWGKNAYFENDSVLLFSYQPVSVNDSSVINERILNTLDSSSRWFVVDTKEPLVVNQPLLGYKIQVNLIHYRELRTSIPERYQIHTLGYFYFQSTKMSSKGKTNRFQKKRAEAYYNSGNHFCRSLFNDRMKENGYEVFYTGYNEKTELYEMKDFEFRDNIVYEDNVARIVGLKNRSYNIAYYQIFNKPMNLEKREGGKSKRSKIYFLKDTCTIRADGSRPDNSIMFENSIGEKRVGAMLPNDFEPEIQK